MSKGTSIYHFSSTVLYDEVFDPREDLIVSLVRTNDEQEDLGSLRLQGGSFGGSLLELEPTRQNPTGTLGYNFSNEFENLCLYLFDASVDTSNFSGVDGPSRSTAISAFDVAPVPGNIFLSGGNTYYKNLDYTPPVILTPTVLYESSGTPVASIATDIPDNWNTSGSSYPTATRLVIGTSCTVVGDQAFTYSNVASGLFVPELLIPYSVTDIGIQAFQGTGFTSLNFEEGLVDIGDAAFYEMESLGGEVIIPQGVETIGQAAFASSGTLDDGGGITSITIPSSVTSIGANAFAQPSGSGGSIPRGNRLTLTRVNCYVNKSIVDAAANSLGGNSGLTEIHVRRNDSSWTAGPGTTTGGSGPLFVYKDLDDNISTSTGWNADTVWVDAASASEFRYTYNNPRYGSPRNGWEFRYTVAEPGSSSNCFFTTVSSASGLFPWELPTWYVTNNSSNTYELSTASTVDLTLSGFTTKFGISSNEPYKLDGPGASILTDLTQPALSLTDPTSFGSFLSGALVLACVDNGGAFSLSGSQEGFYNSGTETLSSKVFSVRALSALQSTRSAELCTFDFKGAVVPEDGYSTIDDTWKLLRVGFKRNLQDVVLYIRENGIYETQQVFSTGFNLEQLPAGIKVGISYSGHMPMEIQNLTINGILSSAS
jgi:hypothetical protein